MSKVEEFISMLLSGEILEKLDYTFPLMRVQDIDEYIAYVEEHWKEYANNSFALYNGYRLDIVSTGVLALESFLNRSFPYLKLNDNLGFRLVNTNNQQVEKAETYEDLVRILNGDKLTEALINSLSSLGVSIDEGRAHEVLIQFSIATEDEVRRRLPDILALFL